MCGVVGLVDRSTNSTSPILDQMRDRLSHRGPDDRGSQFFDDGQRQVGLGHRRLAILDVSSAGHQPMTFGQWSIVFNGEVYNFRELSDQFRGSEPYRSNSDTEVMLRAIASEGPEASSRFTGMFSFAAYDARSHQLLLGRDRTGIKPLYYYYSEGLLLFASEPKAFWGHPQFRPAIDPGSVLSYLQYGYLRDNRSIYRGVAQVPPGTVLTFNLDERNWPEPTVHEYWKLARADSFETIRRGDGYLEARSELDELLRDAFSLRMVSDVPVGIFLSGGYDSSVVAALLSASGYEDLETFTIGFRGANGLDSGDEAPHARRIANHLGTRHHELYFTPGDTLDITRRLPTTFDEPFADTSAIPTLLLSKFTREHVTVSLSADAGDETFAGYGRYPRAMDYWARSSRMPAGLRRVVSTAVSTFPWPAFAGATGRFDEWQRTMRFAGTIGADSSISVFSVLSRQYQERAARALLSLRLQNEFLGGEHFTGANSAGIPSGSDLARMLADDYHGFLMSDVLVKVDRATMAYSLEGRDPLMDHRIFEFAAGLPDEWKLGSLGGKHILKDLVHQYVPREMVDRPKQGFTPPMAQWLRNELRPLLERATNRPWLEKQGIFNPKLVSRMGEAFLSGRMNNSRQMWTIVAFQMWYDHWMDDPGE